MRFRTEATGGYDFGGLIAAALFFLALSLSGLIMLIISAYHYARGQSAPRLLLGGLVLVAPLVIGLFMLF